MAKKIFSRLGLKSSGRITDKEDVLSAGGFPIRWAPEYGIGVEEVDLEHQDLFRLAEEVRIAVESNSQVREQLGELFAYTCRHFANEEMLMERIGYPHYLAHREEHRALQTRVAGMQDRFAQGEAGVSIELLQFVTEWLRCHTTTSDRRIGAYMLRRGLVA